MNLKRIGLDTSKSVFTLHGVDQDEKAILRRDMRRAEIEAFFAKLPPTHVALEACGGSHHLGASAGGAGAYGAADPAAVREAVRPARQERPQRCRGDQRSGGAARDAKRAGEVGRAAGRGDRALGARAAGPATDAAGQRRSLSCC